MDARERADTSQSIRRQRYFWSVSTNRPTHDHHGDPPLSRLYRLAEDLLEGMTVREPDWCELAQKAQALAIACEQRCRK